MAIIQAVKQPDPNVLPPPAEVVAASAAPPAAPPAVGPVAAAQQIGQPAVSSTSAPAVSGGIVGAAKTTTPTDPYSYTPTTGTLSSDQTVEGRLGTLLSGNSPLLQRAKANAMAAAAARGLQNTSLAAGAGEAAVIDTATPIAAADANAAQRQALANQDVTNQFASQQMGISGQQALQGREQTFNASQNALTRGLQERMGMADISARLQAASMSLSGTMASIQAQTATAEKQIDANLKTAGMDDATRRYVIDQQITANEKSQLSQLSGNALNSYANGAAAIMGASMGADEKTTALKNWNAIYAGAPNFPIQFNPAGLPAAPSVAGP